VDALWGHPGADFLSAWSAHTALLLDEASGDISGDDGRYAPMGAAPVVFVIFLCARGARRLTPDEQLIGAAVLVACAAHAAGEARVSGQPVGVVVNAFVCARVRLQQCPLRSRVRIR
jgi:hypothetical protein